MSGGRLALEVVGVCVIAGLALYCLANAALGLRRGRVAFPASPWAAPTERRKQPAMYWTAIALWLSGAGALAWGVWTAVRTALAD